MLIKSGFCNLGNITFRQQNSSLLYRAVGLYRMCTNISGLYPEFMSQDNTTKHAVEGVTMSPEGQSAPRWEPQLPSNSTDLKRL